jgi:hypothetical protein
LNDSLLLEPERGCGGRESGFGGGVRVGGGISPEGSPRRRRLKMECLRVCDWGSVETRDSLEMGAGVSVVRSVVLVG